MRVFVTGTGRCGTSTVYQLARTVHGFTAAHESKAGLVHAWDFPDQHIEVASQLAIAIPRLRALYPDARWVHLIRDRGACIESLARQCWDSMEAFSRQWFLADHPLDVTRAAAQFYDLVNDLIGATIPLEYSMTLHLEGLATGWPQVCTWIGAEYDHDAAASILGRRYNPGVLRGRDNYIEVG